MKRVLYIIACAVIAVLALTGRREAHAQPPAGAPAESVCFGCHETGMVRPEFRTIPDEWRISWHARHDVSCHDCHGGDSHDAVMAMSPQRGFVGVPKYQQVPEFCGKCHVGILKNFLESGHGKALKVKGNGPNCVVCHGAHGVQKAGIDIISEKRCTRCHTYERARAMKQALALTEKKIEAIEDSIGRLKKAGVFTETEGRELFRIQAEFRTLFHTIDVDLVKQKTDSYLGQLGRMEENIRAVFRELDSRRNFAVFLMIIFTAIGITAYLLSRTYTR